MICVRRRGKYLALTEVRIPDLPALSSVAILLFFTFAERIITL